MSKNNDDKLNELTELFKKVAQEPEKVTNSEKQQIKSLIEDDNALMIEALKNMAEEEEVDPCFSVPSPSLPNDDRPYEEIIADNYVFLAKFAIEKAGLKNVQRLKVKEDNGSLIIYALTPKPVELDFEQFCTSDYQQNRELLREAEALQADLFSEDSTQKFLVKIIELIENAVL